MVNDNGLAEKIQLDSAGTHAYHVGEPPDRRAQQCALSRGVDLSPLRARKAVPQDFEIFDYVLAMDEDNYSLLKQICPPGMEYKLSLFLDYAPNLGIREVPDPYYGGTQGFERVLDMVEEASQGLLGMIRDKNGW